MKKFCIILGLILNFSSVYAASLSKEDVKNIILSGENISKERAEIMISQLEKRYGLSDSGKLNISAVLKGSRTNYGLFKDRKTWNFDVSFIPESSKKVITIPKLIEAEFFNGGFKLNLFSKENTYIFLPKGMKVEDLHGLKTFRGASLSSDLILILLTRLGIYNKYLPSNIFSLLVSTFLKAQLSFTGSQYGTIAICQVSLGLKFDLITFPKLHFKVNENFLSNAQTSAAA